MENFNYRFKWMVRLFIFAGFLAIGSCSEGSGDDFFDDDGFDDDFIDGVNGEGNVQGNGDQDPDGTGTLFLVIDEESIDNGNEPNNFSETDVNDDMARIGLRQQLRFFKNNVGKTVDLYTGQVGDEGWHAPKTILTTWANAGPTSNGLQNFLYPGPGLGGGEDDREVLLDEIPNVIPLRAAGLAMLKGHTVFALVYDSDISTNYDPIEANLQGDNLGIVAFKVIEVTERRDGSDSNLPKVTISILDADQLRTDSLYLFKNAPEPHSSSEPEDTVPPQTVDQIVVEKAA